MQNTGDLNADLITRQYKLDKVARFMEMKSNDPKLRQSEIAKVKFSSSSTQRVRRELNMQSPYRLQPSLKTNYTRKQNTPNLYVVILTSNDLKRPQMTSNDLKPTSNEAVKITEKLIVMWCKCRN